MNAGGTEVVRATGIEGTAVMKRGPPEDTEIYGSVSGGVTIDLPGVDLGATEWVIEFNTA